MWQLPFIISFYRYLTVPEYMVYRYRTCTIIIFSCTWTWWEKAYAIGSMLPGFHMVLEHSYCLYLFVSPHRSPSNKVVALETCFPSPVFRGQSVRKVACIFCLSKACWTLPLQYSIAFIKHWSQTDLLLKKNRGGTEARILLVVSQREEATLSPSLWPLTNCCESPTTQLPPSLTPEEQHLASSHPKVAVSTPVCKNQPSSRVPSGIPLQAMSWSLSLPHIFGGMRGGAFPSALAVVWVQCWLWPCVEQLWSEWVLHSPLTSYLKNLLTPKINTK